MHKCGGFVIAIAEPFAVVDYRRFDKQIFIICNYFLFCFFRYLYLIISNIHTHCSDESEQSV